MIATFRSRYIIHKADISDENWYSVCEHPRAFYRQLEFQYIIDTEMTLTMYADLEELIA